MDIACVIPSLRAGGAERVLTGLANELVDQGHSVDILTLMEPDEPSFYPLTSAVRVSGLSGLGTATSLRSPKLLLAAAWRLRRALRAHHGAGRRPDIVLGFTTLGSMLAVLATRGTGIPVIAAERVDPGSHGQRIGSLRRHLRDALYARADHVVVQTARARRGLAWLPDGAVSCIANPIHPIAGQARPDVASAPSEAPDDGRRFRLLGIGRLDPQKGFDLLVAAFGRLALRHPQWDLVIYGDGPDRGDLEVEISRLGLTGRIRLPGTTPDILSALLQSHLLAFPSRYEGFPNALAEGMAAGLPAVGYADVSGVEDLILASDGAGSATGLLADPQNPVDSLTDRLDQLMSNPALRVKIGRCARRYVAAFSPQIHTQRWQSLLSRIAFAHHGAESRGAREDGPRER